MPPPPAVAIRHVEAGSAEMEQFLAETGAAVVARLDERVRATDYPAFVAEREGEVVGGLAYVHQGAQCEVLTLHATEQWHGIGTALIAAVDELARGRGCTRLWLITTNDNVDAIRFYQRRGFRLAALHPGAVDQSRATLKPEIPLLGEYGIPLRDELVLELDLRSARD
jgi:GNAT superfamily N-acetyltransferase